MALYDVVGGVYRKVTKKYDPVDGVYKKVKKAYDPVDGVYRQYFSGSKPISTLAVGASVWLNVDGVQTEFLVVHQGNPRSALYDASCDGTWLLMNNLYERRAWHSSTVNDYENSTIHSYLNSTFLGLLDANIQSAIKQVKIPYRKGSGYGTTVTRGASGLSAKIFLLSATEVSFKHSYMPTGEGAELSFFAGCADDGTSGKRIAKLNGSATYWWLRSPYCYSGNGSRSALQVSDSGHWSHSYCSNSYSIRPAFILDSNTPIDQSTGKNIIASEE